jgi:hypothetical protein
VLSHREWKTNGGIRRNPIDKSRFIPSTTMHRRVCIENTSYKKKLFMVMVDEKNAEKYGQGDGCIRCFFIASFVRREEDFRKKALPVQL